VVAANPDVRPERLRAGMKVWVPSKKNESAPPPAPAPQSKPLTAANTSPTAAKGARTHLVKENDSIASIAKKYHVSEAALLRENKLTEDDAIYVDDTLKIPASDSAAVASSPPPGQSKSSTTAPKSSPPAPAPQPKSASGSTASNTVGSDGVIRSYIVSAGENENTICEAFGISKQTLFEYNRLSPSAKLKPGDEIAIPRVAKGRKH
jgi:LysM repeat protein